VAGPVKRVFINPVWKEVVLPIALAAIAATSGYWAYQAATLADANGKKTDTVHELVNSRVTKLQDDLAQAMTQINELKNTIADLRNRREGDM